MALIFCRIPHAYSLLVVFKTSLSFSTTAKRKGSVVTVAVAYWLPLCWHRSICQVLLLRCLKLHVIMMKERLPSEK